MKVKKILASVFASLFAVTTVATLTSCDDEEPAPTPDSGDTNGDSSNDSTGGSNNETPSVTVTDEDIVKAAMDKLSVDSTITENFTLTTKGTGNVAISWASDNTAVISISEGNATVVRPQFNQSDATVKLTATLVLGQVTKTKEFTVTVTKLVDESKTVSAIKALSEGDKTTAKGVVSGFVYAESDISKRSGFYLTDSTGTIYVYGMDAAKDLAVGDEVYFNAEFDLYYGAPQLKSTANLVKLSSENEADFTGVVTGKTVSELASAANPGDTTTNQGNVYDLLVYLEKIETSSYVNYRVCDPTDTTKYLNIYFKSTIVPGENYEFTQFLDKNVNSYCRVKFYMYGTSSSGKWRGHILSFSNLTVDEQKTYVGDVAKKIVNLDANITAETEVNLPTKLEMYDACTIAWSLKTGSTGASITDGKLIVTPTDTLQAFTLVATITVEGVTDPIVIEFAESLVKTSFDPVSYQEYLSAAVNDMIYVQGTVIAVSYSSQYGNAEIVLQDETACGYYVYRIACTDEDVAAGGKFVLGNVIKIYGPKAEYNNLAQIGGSGVSSVEVISSGGQLPTAADITAIDVVTDLASYANSMVSISQVYYNGKSFVTANNVEINMNTSFYKPTNLEANKIYSFTGVITPNYGEYKLTPTSAASFVEVTENVDIKLVDMCIKSLFEDLYISNTEIEVPTTLYGNTITYEVSQNSTTVSYQGGVVTITVDKVETSTLNYSIGTDLSGTITINVSDAIKTAVADMSTISETTKLSTTDAASNATLFGLTGFSVTLTKNSSSESQVNGGQLRFYKNDILKFEGTNINIKSVSITTATGSYAATGLILLFGEDTTEHKTTSSSLLEATNTGAACNSFTLKNTAQVRIKTITIVYETVAQ